MTDKLKFAEKWLLTELVNDRFSTLRDDLVNMFPSQ